MAKSDDRFVRFRCPRCFKPLKAPLKLIGTRRRCFTCQWVFEVPTVAEAARRGAKVEGYTVSGGMDLLPAELQVRLVAECPLCDTRIDASPDQIGQQVVCPDCGTSVRVPPPPQPNPAPIKVVALDPVDGYAFTDEVDESSSEIRPADKTYFPVICPVCSTDLQAAEDQVGQEAVCPDCRRPFVIPAPRPKPTAPTRVVPATDDELYTLYGGIDQPPADDPEAVRRTYIAAECPACSTRLHAAEDQVGQKLICPDCNTVFPVLPARPRPKRTTLRDKAAGADQYAIYEGTNHSAADCKVVHQKYVALECPSCHARLHATEDLIGQQIVCPDCDKSVVVPTPLPSKPKPGPRREKQEEETYVAADPGAAPDYQPFIRGRRWRLGHGQVTDAETGEEIFAPRPRMAVPRWPLTHGIVTFPFYRNSFARWLVLSVGAVAVATAVIFAVEMSQVQIATSQFMAAMATAAAVITGAMWTVTATVHCLVILRDTAYGYEQVEAWPDGLFVDWALDSFFVLVALALSVLPGIGLGAVVRSPGLPPWSFPAASVLVLFPIILLSMLEANSLSVPLSGWVCRSWIRKWWAWGLFYLETLGPAAAIGLVIRGLQAEFVPMALAVLAPFIVAALMIYFRLLGRLAWCCAGGATQDDRRTAEAVGCDDVGRA